MDIGLPPAATTWSFHQDPKYDVLRARGFKIYEKTAGMFLVYKAGMLMRHFNTFYTTQFIVVCFVS